MISKLTVIVLPTALIIAAIVPGLGLTPSPSTAESRPPAPSPTPTQAENEAQVLQVLQIQLLAWNRGEIDRFMEGYWRSRDTVFVSGDTMTHGWQTLRDRYRTRYSDPQKMGQLAFSEIEVRMFGYDGALAFGRWKLERANDKPHGCFTLVFRKTSDGWKIVHDHTSAAEGS